MERTTATDRTNGARRAGVVALALAALVAAQGVRRALADGETAPAAGPAAGYVGPDNCKKCHLKQFKSWKATPMATSFDQLAPDAAVDKKKAAGLDPAKDYRKDASCLRCHTTGYGTETGYPVVVEGKEWTEAEQARAAKLTSTTCEACHGPGSLYGPYKKDHEDYKREDLAKLGANVPPTKEACLKCHVKECPTMPADYAWEFEKAKASKDKLHEHVALKRTH